MKENALCIWMRLCREQYLRICKEQVRYVLSFIRESLQDCICIKIASVVERDWRTLLFSWLVSLCMCGWLKVVGALKDVQEMGLVVEGEEGNPPTRKILESKGCLAKQRLAVDRYVEGTCPFTKKLFQCYNLHVQFSELPWAITR